MTTQLELTQYPFSPGSKSPGTSAEAAEAVREDAETLRARCLATLAADGPMTADEIAERLGMSVLGVRPELAESVIRAHIGQMKARLVEANERARIELNTQEQATA